MSLAETLISTGTVLTLTLTPIALLVLWILLRSRG